MVTTTFGSVQTFHHHWLAILLLHILRASLNFSRALSSPVFRIAFFVFSCYHVADGQQTAANTLEYAETQNDFVTLVTRNDTYFVDKTGMIETFLRRSDYVSLIARPRGWGKTTNMMMLKAFLESRTGDAKINAADKSGKSTSQRKSDSGNYKLFAGGSFDLGFDKKKELKPLTVAKSKFAMERLGKFPVLWISLANVATTVANYSGFADSLKRTISEVYARNDYLSTSSSGSANANYTLIREGNFNETMLKESLRILVGLMHAHFGQKIYVFVDDYDLPVNRMFAKLVDRYRADLVNHPDWVIFSKVAKSKQFRQSRRLLRILLGNALNHNQACVRQAVISGTYYLHLSDPVLDGLTNVTEYTLLTEDDPYRTYYGFSEEEIEEFQDKPTGKLRETIRNWYGYNVTGNVIHNSASIIDYLASKGKFEDYRMRRRSIEEDDADSLEDKILLCEIAQDSLQRLIDGEVIRSEVRDKLKYDAIAEDWHVLLFGGYLNVLSYETSKTEGNWSSLTVANEEVANIFRTSMVRWICSRLNATPDDFVRMADTLVTASEENADEKKLEDLKTALEGYLSKAYIPKKNELQAETIYKGIVRGLAYSFGEDYNVESSRSPDANNDHKVTITITSKRKKIKRALILEYRIVGSTDKMQTTAKEAVMQIDYRLDSAIKHRFSYINRIAKAVLVFCRRAVTIEYKVDT